MSAEMSKESIVVFDEAHNIGEFFEEPRIKVLNSLRRRQRVHRVVVCGFDETNAGLRCKECQQDR